MIPGVTATVEITDWQALGAYVAACDSTEQAAFLMGYSQALPMKQVPAIADDLDVADVFDSVLDTISHLRECIQHRKERTP